ncbi:MAG: LysM peptidoglycan-binding domain-containing protein [Chloroflexi bacterium]|nr:LysM peptidoglycan-binding domain-containing protein [Chloroflexota bacterium]MBP8058564.1 LysM peptidoglycan-binding domain-containing protein [Chloroflexota bacterium]
MTSPSEQEKSHDTYIWHTLWLVGLIFIVFLGVVYLALTWDGLLLVPLPVASVIPPTLIPTVELPTVVYTPVPTLPLPSATAAAAPQPLTHFVQTGETLSLIAAQYQLPLEELVQANQLLNPDMVWVGQVLLIPTVESGVGPAAASQEPVPFTTPITVTALITPTTINGLPFAHIIVMSETVRANIQTIYAHGQTLGRNPHAFSKVGDSTIDSEYFLADFTTGLYDLGAYAFLQPTITYFAGSLARQGMAVRVGLHSWTALDPLWADKTICEPAETVIACEFRLHNPSLVFIRLGANDMGVPENFAANMREIVAYAIEQGVIPVLGTKADRAEGSDENNAIIRQVAAEYQIPLWDFDLVATTLPGRGLDEDGVHLNIYPTNDFTQAEAFTRGHAMHNLTALLVLDTIRLEIMWDEE